MFTILVVEDDAPLQRMMSAFLGLNGFSVVGAANGEEALNAIDRVMPDLVIADVMMPVMDGWELTRELRRCYPRLPIMLVTARDTIEDKRTGFTSGADDYLTKPVDLDELLLHVQALLRRSQAMTSHQLTVGQTHLDYDSPRCTVSESKSRCVQPDADFHAPSADGRNLGHGCAERRTHGGRTHQASARKVRDFPRFQHRDSARFGLQGGQEWISAASSANHTPSAGA